MSSDVSADGCRALAAALRDNTALFKLKLDGNKIGNEGAVALAQALSANAKLHTLDVCGNGIGDIGAAALVEMLRNNRTVVALTVDPKTLDPQLEGEMAVLLEANWERLQESKK